VTPSASFARQLIINDDVDGIAPISGRRSGIYRAERVPNYTIRTA